MILDISSGEGAARRAISHNDSAPRGAPEARSSATYVFADGAGGVAPRVQGPREEGPAPSRRWSKVTFGLILGIASTSRINVILEILELYLLQVRVSGVVLSLSRFT